MNKTAPASLAAFLILFSSAAHAEDGSTQASTSLEPAAAVMGSGAALFASSYGSSAAFGFATAFADHPRIRCDSAVVCLAPYHTNVGGVALLAPVLGPLMLATNATLYDDYLFKNSRPTHAQTTLLYADAAAQGAGLATIGVGAIIALTKTRAPRVSVVPTSTKEQTGVQVSGTF